MAECYKCGAKPLSWQWDTFKGKYKLYEQEGGQHECSAADLLRRDRLLTEEETARAKAVRKHMEDRGYI